MIFFSLGNHHDFAITTGSSRRRPTLGPEQPGSVPCRVQVGASTDELRQAKAHLEARGVESR